MKYTNLHLLATVLEMDVFYYSFKDARCTPVDVLMKASETMKSKSDAERVQFWLRGIIHNKQILGLDTEGEEQLTKTT